MGQQAKAASKKDRALFVVTELHKPQPDPRYGPADWESWHELDAFRREAERRLAAAPRARSPSGIARRGRWAGVAWA